MLKTLVSIFFIYINKNMLVVREAWHFLHSSTDESSSDLKSTTVQDINARNKKYFLH